MKDRDKAAVFFGWVCNIAVSIVLLSLATSLAILMWSLALRWAGWR